MGENRAKNNNSCIKKEQIRGNHVTFINLYRFLKKNSLEGAKIFD